MSIILRVKSPSPPPVTTTIKTPLILCFYFYLYFFVNSSCAITPNWKPFQIFFSVAVPSFLHGSSVVPCVRIPWFFFSLSTRSTQTILNYFSVSLFVVSTFLPTKVIFEQGKMWWSSQRHEVNEIIIYTNEKFFQLTLFNFIP